MCIVGLALAALAGIGFLIDWFSRGSSRRTWVALGVATAVALVLNTHLLAGPWGEVGRALPLTTAAFLVWCVPRAWRATDPATRARHSALAVWAVFSFVLLGKILLNARLYHYGFTLAMPATLLLVVAGVELLPRSVRWTARPSVVRAVAVAFVVSLMIVHLRWSAELLAPKDFVIGHDGDTIVVHSPDASPRTEMVLQALDLIQRVVPADGTLAVFPEGIMLNYLARRRASTPYVNFMPPELATFGEDAILEAHQRSPPDLVVLVHKDTSEYGVGPFGHDPRYGARIMGWIQASYTLLETIGQDPKYAHGYGIEIFRRR
jgi:hypothetical protein